jgi:hypothetical protein
MHGIGVLAHAAAHVLNTNDETVMLPTVSGNGYENKVRHQCEDSAMYRIELE